MFGVMTTRPATTLPAPPSTPPDRNAQDYAARAKRLARMFGWCAKCGGELVNNHCEPCEIEAARHTVKLLEASIRRARNRYAPNRCEPCEGAGAVDGFSGLTECFVCRGAGLITAEKR